VITYQFRFATAAIPYVNPADLTAPLGGGKEFFAQISGYFTQTYTVTKVVNGVATTIASNVAVAPPRIGPRTGTGTLVPYDDTFAAGFISQMGNAGSEGQVFAGPRDDGFYADLGGIFDLANLRPKGTAQDGLAGFNVHTIAVALPTTLLTSDGSAPPTGNTSPGDATTLGIWASASRQKVSILRGDGTVTWAGPWTQVSRLGLPLINEAVIGIQDKDKWNRMTPADDQTLFGAYFLNPVIVRDAEAVKIYYNLGIDPTLYKSNRTDIIDAINLTNFPTTAAHAITTVGDVLRVDMAIDSTFPNGRAIPGPVSNAEQVDVTDALLTLLLTKGATPISDGVDYNDKPFLTTFPFLALPWQGYDEGHGKPTP
jgi:hypothetical protein